MTKRLAMLLVAVVAATALVAQQTKNPAEVLMQADRDFAMATAAKRVDGWVSYFAADGMQLTPEGNITGHAAIREYMGAAFANPDFSLEWQPRQGDISKSGDLGYTTGRWTSRSKDAQGNPAVRTGRYVTIWKKQADKSWKVVLDTGNPDAPPRKN